MCSLIYGSPTQLLVKAAGVEVCALHKQYRALHPLGSQVRECHLYQSCCQSPVPIRWQTAHRAYISNGLAALHVYSGPANAHFNADLLVKGEEITVGIAARLGELRRDTSASRRLAESG